MKVVVVGAGMVAHRFVESLLTRTDAQIELTVIGELAGDQWNEGDVSCSVVRRVALPDA